VARTPKRKPGVRPYKNYEDSKLQKALQRIADGEISILVASKLYKISHGTLHNRYNGIHVNRPGAPAVFSDQDEMAFLTASMKCGQGASH